MTPTATTGRRLFIAIDLPDEPQRRLARLMPGFPRRWLAEFLATHANCVLAAIPVDRSILFHCRGTDEGHEHVRVETYPLGS